ncbi:hypothetical protein I553_10736 [Mycobacterium xenopi 4042]|uniref:Uncharacterized protein n=1 Tax=Mycobacterium xenopi 4042 TaxID=1299334 RepID=X8DAQ0_MYCXE|nr:hypothetical protein I553_10736 [Mycobacterium xenopi 4042]
MSFAPAPRPARAAWTRSDLTAAPCHAQPSWHAWRWRLRRNERCTSCSRRRGHATQLDATINRSTASKASPTPTSTSSWPATQQSRSLGGVHRRRHHGVGLTGHRHQDRAWSATPQPSGFNNVDYWSVVVGAFVKPVAKAPELRFYQVPVAVILGAPRATSARPSSTPRPRLRHPPGLPAQITPGGDAYQTIADFLTTWLTATRDHPASGDISRYSTSPSIKPFEHAPFTTISVQSIFAATDIPANASNGTTTRILVTAKEKQTTAPNKL